MSTLRVPPGRAGRLRLRRRAAAAERGAELLERKLRALLDEQRTRRREAESAAVAWIEAAEEARRWLGRALAAAGRDGLRRYVPAGPARVTVDEAVTMGVSLPSGAAYAPPGGERAADPGSAALVCARAAHEEAAAAAVGAAAAQSAARAVDAAVEVTRRQVRILRRHWIPLIEESLARLEFALEQGDFEDGVRRRHVQKASRPDLLRSPGDDDTT